MILYEFGGFFFTYLLIYIYILIFIGTESNCGIPKDFIENINNTEKLLDCMEEFHYLGSTNLWFLQYLLYCVGNRHLYKQVLEFAVERLKTSTPLLYVYDPKEIPGRYQFLSIYFSNIYTLDIQIVNIQKYHSSYLYLQNCCLLLVN